MHDKAIVFVDDESFILSALKRELREWSRARSIEIITFGLARQCLDFLATDAERVLIVVSDLRMPEILGSDFLLQVRASWPDIMTILLTGFSETDELMKAVKAGIYSYIIKPWDSGYLQGELEKGLQNIAMRREVREHSAALAASEERVRLLLESTAEAIVGVDLDGTITFVNPSGLAMLGHPDGGALIGRRFHDAVQLGAAEGGSGDEASCAICAGIRSGGTGRIEAERFRRADGSGFAVECWWHGQLRDGVAVGSVVTFSDISERLESQERIRHMATHDGLTGLPVMRLARDRLAMALELAQRSGKRVAVMFVDLDGFKLVNDSKGHDAGDKVLVEVARRLSASMRKMDTVARIGGDEFLVLALELDAPEEAALIARKILERVVQPIDVGGSTAGVGASIGIALWRGAAEDAEALIKRADTAMYQVKHSGKNSYTFAEGDASP